MGDTQLEQTFPTSKGNTYSYRHHPATDNLPTLLFLHGFPSHKEDWVHQSHYFRKLGYGVVLLDTLGFGRSDAPGNQECYRLKSMSEEITQILDHLQVDKPVIGVGHDLGAMLLSRLAIYHPTRVQSLIYIAVGPHSPGQRFDVDAINAFTKSVLGHEYLGYISWMVNDPDAQQDLEIHAESAMKLMFCEDPTLWDTALRPAGAMKAFVTQGEGAKVGPWFSEELQKRHLENYKRSGGYKGAIQWYKMMANNDSLIDEQGLQTRTIDQRTLLIAPEREAQQQKDAAASWHTNLSLETIPCGHWVHLERVSETNKLIEDFVTSDKGRRG